MSKRWRFKKLVNWTVQGPIITRLLTHVLAYNMATLFLLLMLSGIRAVMITVAPEPDAISPGPITFWSQAAPVTICMLLMMPFMVWDLMRLSNRIAGPLYRFETRLKEFAASGKLQTVSLREGDILTDFEKQFNQFTERLHTLYPDTRPQPGRSSEETPVTSAVVPFRQPAL